MELREMNVATDVDETAELLPASQRDEEIESYFIEYAIQKEIINRNRTSASRRLLNQAAFQAEQSSSNTNQKVSHYIIFLLLYYYYIFIPNLRKHLFIYIINKCLINITSILQWEVVHKEFLKN